MRKQSGKKKKIRLFLLCTAFLCVVIWILWGNTALMVSVITITGERIPAAFSGFRIAQVSDLHNAEFGKNNTRLLNLLSECKPDIIVITGDFVDSSHPDFDIALSFAEEVVRIAPVYYVTGNHEARLSQYGILRDKLEAVGVSVLEDRAVQLKSDLARESASGLDRMPELDDETITLIGLSDPKFMINTYEAGETSVMVRTKLKALADAGDSYTILLSHRPELFESYVDSSIDLVLSGHAHGGQFRLPFAGGLIAPDQGLFPKYDAGLYTDGSTHMVVSRGIGNSIIPIRFHNRPEVVLVELCSDP